MGFGQAISDGFSQYATFSGRSRRSAYWYWILFSVLVTIAAFLVDSALNTTVDAADVGDNATIGWIGVVVYLVLLVPTIAVTFRRLHDTGRSGWWWALSLICGIGGLIVFIFCLFDSTPGPNQYGPNPKGV
jgi:uncharacterized membrane protein YhaH (DUF805 family)